MQQENCALHRLLSERAASTSEYATILAVVVIAFMVSANVIGHKLGKTVRTVDSRLVSSGGHLGLTGTFATSEHPPEKDAAGEAAVAQAPKPADLAEQSPADPDLSSTGALTEAPAGVRIVQYGRLNAVESPNELPKRPSEAVRRAVPSGQSADLQGG